MPVSFIVLVGVLVCACEVVSVYLCGLYRLSTAIQLIRMKQNSGSALRQNNQIRAAVLLCFASKVSFSQKSKTKKVR